MNLRRSETRLWAAILGAPTLFLIDLQVSYSLMEHVCTSGRIWPLHASSIVALILIGTAGIASWRDFRSERDDKHRLRFLAASGAALSAVSALSILGLIVPKVFLIPC